MRAVTSVNISVFPWLSVLIATNNTRTRTVSPITSVSSIETSPFHICRFHSSGTLQFHAATNTSNLKYETKISRNKNFQLPDNHVQQTTPSMLAVVQGVN